MIELYVWMWVIGTWEYGTCKHKLVHHDNMRSIDRCRDCQVIVCAQYSKVEAHPHIILIKPCYHQ